MGSNPAFLLQKRVIYNTKTTDRSFFTSFLPNNVIN